MNPGAGRAPLRALAAAFVLVALYALLASARPGASLAAFFLGPFSSGYAIFSMLAGMGPLLVAGLGAATAFRAGRFNLGGEGQAAVGAFAAALVLLSASGPGGEARLPPWLVLTLALLAAAAAGGLLALLSGLAERWAKAEVLLTSFLLGQAAVICVDWAVAGPLRDAASNLLAMPPHAALYQLPRLAPPSALDLGAPLALLAAGLMSWLLLATRSGYELRLAGENWRFTRAAGFSRSLALWPLALSGALHGLGGALVVAGSSGRAVKSMTAGLGWNGLTAALLASTNPLALLPSTFFLGWLDSGARSASILGDLSPDSGAVLKALLLFAVTMKALPGRPRSGAREVRR